MHEEKVKTILSNSNGINLYRGCQHGCIYCDSRSLCYNMNHNFEDVLVKINAIELLEDKLKRKRKKCMIATGSMSDPYMDIENKYQLTRKSLELVYKYGFGISILTKSDLVLRDLELLKKINEKTKCVVQMTLTTYDDNLSKIIEPNVCITSRRVEVLKILSDNLIPTIVWLSPFLPYINDNLKNIEGLLNYLKEAKVKGIVFFGVGLTLRDGNREYFYQKLDQFFPGLKQKYINEFKNNYQVISKHNNYLSKVIISFCKKNNIMYDTSEVFDYISRFDDYKQLTLFD